MANNRMSLVYRPTGHEVFIGKRLSDGWYGVPHDLTERVERLFAAAYEGWASGQGMDDFALVFESEKFDETELRRDAERYRWLRDQANFGSRICPQVCLLDALTGAAQGLHAEQVDEAVDMAMQETPK